MCACSGRRTYRLLATRRKSDAHTVRSPLADTASAQAYRCNELRITRTHDTMNQDLQGKTAVVTGGSKGIGYAIADALAAAGCNVMISARNEDEVQRAARTLSERNPGTVAGMACDVRRHEDVQRMIAATVERFGGLHVLVNNAGVGKFAPMGELTPDDWRQVMQTNVDGVFYCCHEAIPHLRKHDDSWIINIASLAGEESVRRRRCLQRVEVRAGRIQRGADAGRAGVRHPRQLHHAGQRRHALQRPHAERAGCVEDPAGGHRRSGDGARCGFRRGRCRHASRSGRRSRRGSEALAAMS